jgi:hypothetical protein
MVTSVANLACACSLARSSRSARLCSLKRHRFSQQHHGGSSISLPLKNLGFFPRAAHVGTLGIASISTLFSAWWRLFSFLFSDAVTRGVQQTIPAARLYSCLCTRFLGSPTGATHIILLAAPPLYVHNIAKHRLARSILNPPALDGHMGWRLA